MPKPPDSPARSLAATLRPLLRSRKASLTLGEMVAGIEGDGGLGPVLFVLVLPVLLPLPPGVSMVLALPLLVVAPQIVWGRRKLWLPKALARRTVKRADLVKLTRRILPLVQRVETLAKPRLGFLTGKISTRMVGMACTLAAVVLVLPIPFANLVPALALGAFSLGLARKDGVFVLAGYGLILAAGAVIALGVHGAAVGFGHLRAML
jgi:hypothetical protein